MFIHHTSNLFWKHETCLLTLFQNHILPHYLHKFPTLTHFVINIHHCHHCVACPLADVAVPTRTLHAPLFCARWQAVARPMLSGARSDWTVCSQVWRSRPDGQLQSVGTGAKLALRADCGPMDLSARAMWPQNLIWLVWIMLVSGGWSVSQQCFPMSCSVDPVLWMSPTAKLFQK